MASARKEAAALRRASDALGSALGSLELLMPDAAGTDIEAALAALGETDGRGVSEEIVSEIFSHFCVGK